MEIGEGANGKKTAMVILLYLNRPMKRNPRQSWIFDSMPWIPDPSTGVQTLCLWNLDSIFYLWLGSGFRGPGFLDSTSKNFPDQGFHM